LVGPSAEAVPYEESLRSQSFVGKHNSFRGAPLV
jgi:hypothetical protein